MKALFGALFVAVMVVGAADAATLRVVTSVKPLQSLAASIMEGVAVPDVLIKGGASAHAYSLRPSDAEILNRAEVIFWIGPSFEIFLERPLSSLGSKARVVALAEAPGMKIMPLRTGGLWSRGDDHNESHADSLAASRADGHIWLDPANDKIIAAQMTAVLSAADSANTTRYRQNLAALNLRLDALDQELRRTLAPVKEKPFIVFHDATQYFEASYGLRAMGAVAADPDRPPGARRLAQIKDDIADKNFICVFADPQFEPKLVRTLIDGSAARTGILDPEGSTLASGPELHFNLMRGLADNLVRCLTTP